MLKGRSGDRGRRPDEPDLRTQLESLLDQVWKSEADWRLWDRLDAAVRMDDLREKTEGRDQEKRLLD